MQEGIVKFYNSARGYGFIQPSNGSSDVLSTRPPSSAPESVGCPKARKSRSTRKSIAATARPASATSKWIEDRSRHYHVKPELGRSATLTGSRP